MIAVQRRRYGIIIDDGMVVLMMKGKEGQTMLARKLPTELVPSRETKLLAKSKDHQAVRVTFA